MRQGSSVSLAPLIAQVEFDGRDALRIARFVTAAKQAIFASVAAALGLLSLILTVAEVQTVSATIAPGCFEKSRVFVAVLRVRIHLPPAASRANHRFLRL
jgi:hypothetical protein